MEGYIESLRDDHALEIHTVDRIKEIQSNMHMFQIARVKIQATFVAFEYVKEEGKIFFLYFYVCFGQGSLVFIT